MSSTYKVDYTDGITVSLDGSTLKVEVDGSTVTERSDSDISTDIQGNQGISYRLRGLNLWPEEAMDSDVPPFFPVSATCNATVPANLQAGVSYAAYVILALVFLGVGAVIFLLLYKGQNRVILGAKRWLTGREQ